MITATHNAKKALLVPTFNVVIRKAEDVGGYWAECTNISGCFTQGKTIKEIQERMFEVVDLVLEDDYPEIKDYFLEFEVQNA